MDPRDLSLTNEVIRYRVRMMDSDELLMVAQHLYAYGLRDPLMPDSERYQITGVATRCLRAAAVVVMEVNGAVARAMLIEARPGDLTQWVLSADTIKDYAGEIMYPEVLAYAREAAASRGAQLVRRVETVTFEPV